MLSDRKIFIQIRSAIKSSKFVINNSKKERKTLGISYSKINNIKHRLLNSYNVQYKNRYKIFIIAICKVVKHT